MPKFIDYCDPREQYYDDKPRTVAGYDKKGDEIWKENDRHELVYATERQTLAFANKLREAGGADVIPALMPSTPVNPAACLIANALNFGCKIAPRYRVVRGSEEPVLLKDGNRGYEWEMTFPPNLVKERAQAVAKAVGSELRSTGGHYAISLPPEIGNVARAFDRGIGWTKKYVYVSPNPCADVTIDL